MKTLQQEIASGLLAGKSYREVARDKGVTLYQVQKTANSEEFALALAAHRQKLAAKSYENATLITDLVTRHIEHYVTNNIILEPKDLRDLAWIAAAQFKQAEVLLGRTRADADLSSDQELADAAKLLMSRLLRQEAQAISETVDVPSTDYRVEEAVPSSTPNAEEKTE